MVTALILSGGTGTRLGASIPKQYIETAGRPIISFCLDVFERHSLVDAVWIVADVRWREYVRRWTGKKFRGFSEPGENRQMSVFHGLCDLRKSLGENDYVIVHDAVRPCVSEQLITDCVHAAIGHDGALPVLPMKDTVYVSKDGKKVSSLIDRSTLFAGQAPECFLVKKYYAANEALLPDKIFKINGSAEPALMAGMDIALVAGDEGNFKITTKADMERFAEIAACRDGLRAEEKCGGECGR